MSDHPLRSVPVPRGSTNPTIPIVRCSAANHYKLQFICLGAEVFGTEVHYSGRTVPCLGRLQGCHLCEKNRPTRWVGYISATDVQHGTRRWLAELTPGIMPDIQRWFKAWGSLRGHQIEITRPSLRPTGRCEVRLSRDCVVPPNELPDADCVPTALTRIWSGSLAANDASAAGDPPHRPGEVIEGALSILDQRGGAFIRDTNGKH